VSTLPNWSRTEGGSAAVGSELNVPRGRLCSALRSRFESRFYPGIAASHSGSRGLGRAEIRLRRRSEEPVFERPGARVYINSQKNAREILRIFVTPA
jgi:hypothetical protein